MNFSQRVATVNKFNDFVIPKTKAANEQCTSTAPFVLAQGRYIRLILNVLGQRN